MKRYVTLPCVLAVINASSCPDASFLANVSLGAALVTFMSMRLTQTKMDWDADLHTHLEK